MGKPELLKNGDIGLVTLGGLAADLIKMVRRPGDGFHRYPDLLAILGKLLKLGIPRSPEPFKGQIHFAEILEGFGGPLYEIGKNVGKRQGREDRRLGRFPKIVKPGR